MKIFITGGAGYIGTHTCVELLQNNYDIVIYDNLSNGSSEAIRQVETITGKTVKLIILRAMKTNNIKTLVFSYSATVYGDPIELPLTEDHPLRTTNPYG